MRRGRGTRDKLTEMYVKVVVHGDVTVHGSDVEETTSSGGQVCECGRSIEMRNRHMDFMVRSIGVAFISELEQTEG